MSQFPLTRSYKEIYIGGHTEKEIIEGVLRLANRCVRSVMTPRSEIFWVDSNESQDELIMELREAAYSRLLVCDGTVDRAVLILDKRYSCDGASRRAEKIEISWSPQLRFRRTNHY